MKNFVKGFRKFFEILEVSPDLKFDVLHGYKTLIVFVFLETLPEYEIRPSSFVPGRIFCGNWYLIKYSVIKIENKPTLTVGFIHVPTEIRLEFRFYL